MSGRSRQMDARLISAIASLATSEWLDDAACVDVEGVDFLPSLNEYQVRAPTPSQVERWHRRAAPAVAVCAACPVRQDCLDAALAIPVAHDWGVWGGTLPHERRRMRAERAGGE